MLGVREKRLSPNAYPFHLSRPYPILGFHKKKNCQAMQGLSPAEFEGVLHPVFEEDEWKLILVGGALGAAVGVFQLYVLF